MKLTCVLCGGELQMKAGGQRACCANCGLEYSKERLMEMLQSDTSAAPIPEPVCEPVKSQMHNFYIKRKFNLTGSLAKASIYLDGEQCAILGASGEACVPISVGTHEVVVRIATGAGLVEMESVTFQVKDRDVAGLLYLKQTAFTASWVFEVREK